MCPHCGKPVLVARIEPLDLYELTGGSLKGVKYSCMSCSAVLSLGIDPLAQASQIVSDVLAAIGRR
jgi:ribosomal protein S27AE